MQEITENELKEVFGNISVVDFCYGEGYDLNEDMHNDLIIELAKLGYKIVKA